MDALLRPGEEALLARHNPAYAHFVANQPELFNKALEMSIEALRIRAMHDSEHHITVLSDIRIADQRIGAHQMGEAYQGFITLTVAAVGYGPRSANPILE